MGNRKPQVRGPVQGLHRGWLPTQSLLLFLASLLGPKVSPLGKAIFPPYPAMLLWQLYRAERRFHLDGSKFSLKSNFLGLLDMAGF
jgi:hypothetical protein